MNSNFVIVHSNDALYHHGILGQKWGIRRFQPYPKGSSSKGRFVGKVKGSVKKAVKQSQERKKQKIIRSGDRNKVLKYSNKLSDSELVTALNRIRINDAIKSKPVNQQTEQKNVGKKKINSVLKYARGTNSALSEGIKLYKNVTEAKAILKAIKKAKKKG